MDLYTERGENYSARDCDLTIELIITTVSILVNRGTREQRNTPFL